jgi:hypothetical protein
MSISSVNAVFLISVPLLLPVTQQLQDWAVEDIYDVDDVDVTDTAMSVDGILTGGLVLSAMPMNVALMADSPSISFFEAWYAGQRGAFDSFPAEATITLTSVKRNFTLVKGYLSRFKPMPDAKKTLQSRKFRLTWQNIIASPVGPTG